MPVQHDQKEAVIRRLDRIEGQIRGLKRLVEADTYCVDVLTQLAAAHEALRGVSKIVMRDHLQHCVTDALRADDAARAEKTYQELMDVIYKFAR